MSKIDTSNRTVRRPRRRVAQVAASAGLAASLLFAGGAPASAEVDSLNDQCISVGGYTRGCTYSVWVNWGSGWSWSIRGQLYDSRADGWYNTFEYKLNRQWSSNTYWSQVLRAGDWQTHTSGVSGYDPTYGAWVRLCTVSPSGAKYCNASRYVADNS